MGTKSESSSTFRRLRSGRTSFFRSKTKQRKKLEPDEQSEECLNENILTARSADFKTNQDTYIPTLKTKMIKPFQQFLQKNNSSDSTENISIVDTFVSITAISDGAAESRRVTQKSMFEVCGGMPARTSPQEDNRIQDLQKQLHELRTQVVDLNDELDNVYVERVDAISKLERIIDVPNKNAIDLAELEEIRMILTAEGDGVNLTPIVQLQLKHAHSIRGFAGVGETCRYSDLLLLTPDRAEEKVIWTFDGAFIN